MEEGIKHIGQIQAIFPKVIREEAKRRRETEENTDEKKKKHIRSKNNKETLE